MNLSFVFRNVTIGTTTADASKRFHKPCFASIHSSLFDDVPYTAKSVIRSTSTFNRRAYICITCKMSLLEKRVEFQTYDFDMKRVFFKLVN